jgi:hypothetical protein
LLSRRVKSSGLIRLISFPETLGIPAMGGLERKNADQLARWRQFEERECGFFPPGIAALYLGMTVQGLYASADRGWIRFIKVGSERFYSYSDLAHYRKASRKRFDEAAVTPLERHLAKIGVSPHPRYSETSEPIVEDWKRFIADHDGAFPPRMAALHLKIGVQSVRWASKAGWIRCFSFGRENYYSRRDVVAYWHTGSKKNPFNRPVPPFAQPGSPPPIDGQSL